MPFKSASFYLMAMLYHFLIILAPPPTILQRSVEGRVVAAIRSLDSIPSSPSNYVPLKVPYENKGGHDVAPNGHYVNGHTFGSELCSSSKGKNSP
ncbi:unnamed protein product [Malus baccata var. baccata]